MTEIYGAYEYREGENHRYGLKRVIPEVTFERERGTVALIYIEMTQEQISTLLSIDPEDQRDWFRTLLRSDQTIITN